MFGWTYLYDFNIKNENFTLFHWHENTFKRDKSDYEKNGYQGAISFWWNINKSFSTGVQYRYAIYNLGYNGSQYGMIYSLKYYF
jgi:hypothetical protein